MGKICVECEDPSWTGQPPIVAPELPADGGGVKVVDELPEKGQKGMAYVLVNDLDNPTSSQGIFVYDEGWLLTAQPVSEAVQKVDELPDEGQPGVLYYVSKTGDDTYDLYRWIDNDWIKVDTDIKLYGSTGQNTDGAMTQKAATDAISNLAGQAKLLTKSNYGSGVQYIEAWKLPVGLYRVDNNGKRPSQSAFVHWRPSSNDSSTEMNCNVFLVADHAQNDSAKTIVGFYTGGGDSDGPYKITVFEVTAVGGLDNQYRMLSTQEIVDNLTSTETKKALSANQGKVLNDKINGLGTVEYVTFTSIDPATMTATPSKTPAEVKAMIDAGKTVYYKLAIPQRLSPVIAAGTYLFAPQFIGDLNGSDWNRLVATLFSVNGGDTVLMGAYVQDSNSSTGTIGMMQLTTSAYVNDAIDSVAGDLTTLTTTDKTSLVAAVNELNTEIGDIEAALNAINNGGNA